MAEPKTIAEIVQRALEESIAQGPMPTPTDEELHAWEAQMDAWEAERIARQEAIVKRSGLPDIETFNEMTKPSGREMFILEMRETPERYALQNPNRIGEDTSFGFDLPKGDNIAPTSREQFIMAHCMTPERYAFSEPENFAAASQEFFGDRSPFADGPLS